MKRNNLITKEASIAATPCQRFEKETPNEMWQADFKGHFALGNGERCYPLNIIDDCSRFNLCCSAHTGETLGEMWPTMISLFNEYGLPFSFLCDNGNPWGTAQSLGYSRFEVMMMELGILVLHGRSYHPQTQGKEERFNQNMKRECLKNKHIQTMIDAQKEFDEYRKFYNEERPHHALDLDTTSQRYTPSNKIYTGKIEQWEYPKECEVRKVKRTGYFNFNNQVYYLNEGFADKEIAVRESHIEGCISLFFRQFRIGRINVEKRAFSLKRAYLIEGDPRK